ncbi:MAG: hypothetical protein Q8N23_30155 [Archangium sp.]|nr:hypothetical protein [Archangium sp.]MDP3575653.1 hypothetical protein [Archangium sp.]
MPIDVSETKTKSGHPVVRTNFITEVTVAEAQGYIQKVIPGGKYDGFGHLVVGNVTGVSSEVKKVLGSQKPDPHNPPPVAVILSSALARMAASLTLRVTGNHNTDSFRNEGEALEWLDGRMTEFMRKKGSPKVK